MVKRLMALQAVFIMAVAVSCKDKDEDTIPVPTNEDPVHLKFDTKNVVAFQVISSGNSSDLNESELETHFGNRVALFIPTEIIIKKDSLILLKENDLQEGYQAKWENDNQLYILNEGDNSWTFIGEKTNTTSFHMKFAFYSKRVTGISRNYVVLGNEYALDNHDELMAADETQSSLVWLKIEAVYH
ncbi:hypothetical protein [Gynurincola endophyticus]|uniref:hypothetical protein n=1 Tax=Gynurincola endophyticus TaxID=2479004 RepID=UPI000F8F0BCD|nr:hypothetical protein [Gynurincola endophyticus]